MGWFIYRFRWKKEGTKRVDERCADQPFGANWQVQHWRTIESCYSRSPFFEFYRDAVWGLLEKKETFLLDMNMRILEWLKTVLKFPGNLSLTDEYQKHILQI
jgi:hypothetical protein